LWWSSAFNNLPPRLNPLGARLFPGFLPAAFLTRFDCIYGSVTIVVMVVCWMPVLLNKKGRSMNTWPERFDRHLKHVKTYVPQLMPLRATLIPFEDVICGEQAGPQPQSRDYDPEEEPFFCIDVDTPDRSQQVWIRFTADRIKMQSIVHFTDRQGEEDCLVDDEVEMTLEGVFEFLRQLPRHAHSFTVDRRG